ncbi:MAG: hypothetical protein E4G74_00780 [Erysipelotrichales bacterium]|nr:MAG: hypothetical protein E4G74_00780 [Erysipelotrichales bacterium]
MHSSKKPNPIRILIWIIYLIVSLGLVYMADGFAYLSGKADTSVNVPVSVIAGLVAVFSVLRIAFELRSFKTKEENTGMPESEEPKIFGTGVTLAQEDEIKICIHCGKAEPLDTIYCSSCGNRFPER